MLTNRPVSFTLYSTTTRYDQQGAVVQLDREEAHRHAPLITVLRYGKRSRHVELGVRGDALDVPAALGLLQQGVNTLGFQWTDAERTY